MRKLNNILFVLVVLLFISSCTKDDPPEPDKSYSYFVAGHSYGKPIAVELGLHPPFKSEFDYINSYTNSSFGILTGDIVRVSDEESWDAVDQDILDLGLPVYFAPGNHDTYNYELYRSRYGDPDYDYRTYGSFQKSEDLIILLDANIDNYNISGDQLVFLEDVLDANINTVRNVFVFVHQMIWWDDDNIFKNVVSNWPPYTPDTNNYWGTVEPLFRDYSAPVFIFAGDLGANQEATPYMYYHDNNITYIGSGMGEGTSDNWIFVSVDNDGMVTFDLLALQGDRNRFGRLEDYVLP